jgi:hypothetical protein
MRKNDFSWRMFKTYIYIRNLHCTYLLVRISWSYNTATDSPTKLPALRGYSPVLPEAWTHKLVLCCLQATPGSASGLQ